MKNSEDIMAKLDKEIKALKKERRIHQRIPGHMAAVNTLDNKIACYERCKKFVQSAGQGFEKSL